MFAMEWFPFTVAKRLLIIDDDDDITASTIDVIPTQWFYFFLGDYPILYNCIKSIYTYRRTKCTIGFDSIWYELNI